MNMRGQRHALVSVMAPSAPAAILLAAASLLSPAIGCSTTAAGLVDQAALASLSDARSSEQTSPSPPPPQHKEGNARLAWPEISSEPESARASPAQVHARRSTQSGLQRPRERILRLPARFEMPWGIGKSMQCVPAAMVGALCGPTGRADELADLLETEPSHLVDAFAARYLGTAGPIKKDCDLLLAYNQARADLGMRSALGGYIDRGPDETAYELLRRAHASVLTSLRAGEPPILGLSSYVVRRGTDGQKGWDSLRAHTVVVTGLFPERLGRTSSGFVLTCIEPFTGREAMAFVCVEEFHGFTAWSGSKAGGAWVPNSPFLLAIAPDLGLCAGADWSERVVVVADYLIWCRLP